MSEPDLPAELQEHLSEFEEAWRAWRGGTAEKPSLVARWEIAQADQALSLSMEQWDRFWSDLLYAEVYHLSEHGEQLYASDYEDRYPDKLNLIADVFGQFSWATNVEPVSRSAEIAAASTGFQPQSGMLIGKYKLIKFVASGGMGAVWLVEANICVVPGQSGGQLTAALKFIKPDNRKQVSPDVISLFQQEINHLCALNCCPSIAKIMGGGLHEDAASGTEVPYLVMEYLQGMTLGEYASQKPFQKPYAAALSLLLG